MSEKDGKRGWIIVCACFMSGFLFDGVCYSYGLIFIELLEAFNESKALTAGVGSVMFSMSMLAPLIGMMINRLGCRVTNVVSGTTLALGYISSAFCTGIIYLYFSIGILVGIGLPALEITRSVIIVHYFMKRRSLARGISSCGTGVGAIVFNPLTRWLIDEYGWRGTLLIEGGIALNLVAFGLLMRPFIAPSISQEVLPMQSLVEHAPETVCYNSQENKAHPNGVNAYTSEQGIGDHLVTLLSETTDEVHVPTTSNKQHDTGKCFDFKLFKLPSFRLVICSTFFLGMAYFAPVTFIPDMAVSSGWTRRQATWLMTAIGIANTIGRMLIGLLMDIECLNRVLTFVTIHVMLGVVTAAMPFCQQYSLLMAVCIGFGFLTSGQSILVPLIMADLFGETLIADTLSMFSCAWGVGCLIVGPMTGAIFDASGSYATAFIAIGVAFMLSGVLYIPLYKVSGRNYDENKRSKNPIS